MKKILSFLLCLAIIVALPGFTVARADGENDKKIARIKAEYIGKVNESGEVTAGDLLKLEDFKIEVQYEGEQEFKELPNGEKAYIKFSPDKVPADEKSGFTVTVSYNNTDRTVGKKVLEAKPFINKTNLVFKSMEAKWNGSTAYHIGDEIKKGEITLTVRYDKITSTGMVPDTRTIAHSQFTISPSSIISDGANNVTVTYHKMTTTVVIKGSGSKGLEIIYSGDKNIVVGGSIDVKKVKANIVYSNNDKKPVNAKDLTFENLEVKAPGPHEVIVKYGDIKGKLTVNGIAKNPEKISATYTGTDLVVGSKIDISQITVEVINNDKTKDRITTGFTISPEKVTKIGPNIITVTYKGYSDTITIKATEMLPKNITATYNGSPVIEGQTVNKSSILVTAYYPDGTSKTVSDFELSTETMNKVGMQDVIVKYKNLTATIYVPVTAKMVTKLEAVYSGGALEQFQSIDRKKLVVTATFNDGSRSNVDDYMISTTTASKVGENLFTVNYGAKRATFTVEALARRITGTGTLKSEVGSGEYSSTITAFIQDQVVREGIKLETEEIEEDIIKPAIKRVNNANTKKYIAFDLNVDSFQFDENQYMTAEFTVPDGFDPAKVAIFFTPDRKKTMIQLTGGLVASNLYRFYVYESGSYVIMQNNNNDVTMQEMRDNDQRKPFMVVAIDRSLPVKTKSKIKPYVLFSAYKNEEFTYEVDNEDVLTVTKTGEMTTKAAGTASVTVTAKSEGLSETFEITVKGNVEE